MVREVADGEMREDVSEGKTAEEFVAVTVVVVVVGADDGQSVEGEAEFGFEGRKGVLF